MKTWFVCRLTLNGLGGFFYAHDRQRKLPKNDHFCAILPTFLPTFTHNSAHTIDQCLFVCSYLCSEPNQNTYEHILSTDPTGCQSVRHKGDNLPQREAVQMLRWHERQSCYMESRQTEMLGCGNPKETDKNPQFSNANIQDGQFRYVQRKTGVRVIIPLSPKIIAVLERNGGEVPKLNSVTFNRIVKVVCERAGLTNKVEIRHSKGDTYEHLCVPKFSLVSSHCCRRTLCTLLAKKGVPIPSIMHISGHKSLASLQKYLRQSVSETADELAKLDYFK